MKSETLLNEVNQITQTGNEFVKKKIKFLAPNQSSWRPTLNSWNIEEILAHLNACNTYYNQAITNKLAKTRFNQPSDIFVSSPLGKSAWSGMKLGKEKNIKRRYKSPKNFDPIVTPTILKENITEHYLETQSQFESIVNQLKRFNIKKIRMGLSINKLVKLRLGDVLLFISYHNERHLQQIQLILQNKNFPDKQYE